MKKILSAGLLLLIFSGCVDKKSVLRIDNVGLCTNPMATLYINDINVQNSSETFNIPAEEIKSSLIAALNETNCFVVSTAKMTKASLESKSEYMLDAKVILSQEKEVVEKNIFKKSESEHLTMAISLAAGNNGNKVTANVKSELLIDKSKYLGVKTKSDVEGDNKTIVKNATKKVSIALSEGFSKLK
ncbi:hypothetical protein [Sulfurimonas sp.]|uniref:hypothetical protein n=1 Tax=Sulfurimonas sp. TaxID=2022749 RepID=UPI0025D5E783|nr:hypothetical protein [Sulfurimonas sp.]MBW6488847.1 hypothetical protein [Sulfurimonas sp.]